MTVSYNLYNAVRSTYTEMVTYFWIFISRMTDKKKIPIWIHKGSQVDKEMRTHLTIYFNDYIVLSDVIIIYLLFSLLFM